MPKQIWRSIMPQPLRDQEMVSMRTDIYRILITLLMISGAILIIGLISHVPFMTPVAGLAVVISVSMLWLTRQGYLTAVRIAIPACAFGIATYAILTNEGLRDEGMFIYPFTLVLAGLLLGKYGIIMYTILTLSAITAIGFAESKGFLVIPSYSLPKVILIDLLLSFTAAMLYLSIVNLTQSLERSRRLHAQAQHELAQRIRAEEEIRMILKTAHDGFSVADMEGRFLEVNDAYCRMLGYSREEFLQLTIAAINPTYQNSAEAVRQFEQVKHTGSRLFESQLRRKDGQILLVEIGVNYMDVAGGRLFAFVRDITARKRAEEELLRAKEAAEFANLAKTNFLHSVSHELRTPLNHILGFAQLLAGPNRGTLNSRQMKDVNIIINSGTHLLALIDDILMLSQLDLGKNELHLKAIPLKLLLENSLHHIREKDLKRKLILTLKLSSVLETATLLGDYQKLKQILFQLLSNAVKFTPDGGTILLEAERNGADLVISVTDTGIGIAPEHQEKIFTPFYQIQGGLVGKTPGTGLGLPIVRRLVELHGGKIWVSSAGVGTGSRFSFSVPQDSEIRSE